MDITKHVTEINGFLDAYEEVYKSVRVGNQLRGCSHPPYYRESVLMRAREVLKAFEQQYNVNLIKTKNPKNNISSTGLSLDMVYPFDTVDFKTPENQTMCLLKWA